jgi:hypothetical protein
MCHVSILSLRRTSLDADARDFQFSVVLTVTRLTTVVLTTTELNDTNLIVTTVIQHFGCDLGTGNDWRTDLDVVAINDHQNVVKRDDLAWLNSQKFNLQALAFYYTVLLTTALNNCVHTLLHQASIGAGRIWLG